MSGEQLDEVIENTGRTEFWRSTAATLDWKLDYKPVNNDFLTYAALRCTQLIESGT
jgi:hypothetical protein